MSWTEERIERLKKMWHDGATASQIAEELGGVSRNAVIGKAHRLGLEQRPSPVKPGEEKERKPAAAAAPSAGAPKAAAKAEAPAVRQLAAAGSHATAPKNLTPAEVTALVAFMQTLRPDHQPAARTATEAATP